MKRQVLYRPCREFLSFDTFEHVFYRTNILVSMLHYGFIWFSLCSSRFDRHDHFQRNGVWVTCSQPAFICLKSTKETPEQ